MGMEVEVDTSNSVFSFRGRQSLGPGLRSSFENSPWCLMQTRGFCIEIKFSTLPEFIMPLAI